MLDNLEGLCQFLNIFNWNGIKFSIMSDVI